jgi:nucleotide-binding universal stress UspA family protein
MKNTSNMKTNKMKKVLIALDYDPSAQKVAESGYSLAKTMEAEVILLHVVSNPAYYPPTEHVRILGFVGHIEKVTLKLDTVDGLKKASQLFIDKSKKHLDDKNIQTLIKEGDFAESILQTAKELNADVIVMGSHSHKWLENINMGSVTEKVLHQTTIPLFIVPSKLQN